MKYLLIILIFIGLNQYTVADITPMPIIIKGINTSIPSEIQMVKEFVNIKLYPDSSIVECEFLMKNHGDLISLPIGFPVMNFSHWGWNVGKYGDTDLDKFEILIGNNILSKDEIHVPKEMDSIYNLYQKAYAVDKRYKFLVDSIYNHYGVIRKKNGKINYPKGSYESVDNELNKINTWRENQISIDSDLRRTFNEKMEKGNYLWYVWDVNFKKGESKTIKVKYTLPTGMGYGGNYRYVKYLLNTGKGWKNNIEEANINIELFDVNFKNIEEVSPLDYQYDSNKKVLSWIMINIEPTTEHDIFVRYFNPKERRKHQKYMRRKQRQIDRFKSNEES